MATDSTQRFDLFVFRYGVRSTRLRGARCQVGVDGVGLAESTPFGTVGSSHLDDDVAAPAGGAARVNPAP
ncbi:hypothetical protein [Rhodococcoides fascians]|uniref:hypothetical protein n=1 Tax=Rhodococcoides fascians TaxID=1828 RepID=UPI0007AB7ADE|nr:hypothetical protein [Rhodococcus fascians]OZC40955.1 hypothetical protein CHX23_09040 [Rhodococcus fascians]